MDVDTEARFADCDAQMTAIRERTAAFRDATADAIDAMEERLAAIDQQNQRLAKKIQVLGGSVNTSIEVLQEDTGDGHGDDAGHDEPFI